MVREVARGLLVRPAADRRHAIVDDVLEGGGARATLRRVPCGWGGLKRRDMVGLLVGHDWGHANCMAGISR